MNAKPIDQQRVLLLPGGRQLAYRLFGDESGLPIFFFHGWPGSSAEIAYASNDALLKRLRVIALNRPGSGNSDPDPDRTILSWVDDVRSLADALSIERLSILACSGGSPYALACGHVMPDRLQVLALASPLAPMWHPAVRASLSGPYRWVLSLGKHRRIATQFLRLAIPVVRSRPRSVAVRAVFAAASLAKPSKDREALATSSVRQCKLTAGREAFAHGPSGPAKDLSLLTSPWGFDPFAVPVTTRLWHGQRDTTLPASMTRLYQERMPDVSAVIDPDAGHTSIFADYVSDMLDWIEQVAGDHQGATPGPEN